MNKYFKKKGGFGGVWLVLELLQKISVSASASLCNKTSGLGETENDKEVC